MARITEVKDTHDASVKKQKKIKAKAKPENNVTAAKTESVAGAKPKAVDAKKQKSKENLSTIGEKGAEKAAAVAEEESTKVKAKTKAHATKKTILEEVTVAVEPASTTIASPKAKGKRKAEQTAATAKEEEPPAKTAKVGKRKTEAGTTKTTDAKVEEAEKPVKEVKGEKSNGKVQKTKKSKPKKAPSPSPEPEPELSEMDNDIGDESEDGEDGNASGEDVVDAVDSDDEANSQKDDAEDQSDEESEGLLHGFTSDSADSSDEDEDEVDGTPVDVATLPIIAKDDATVKRRLEKAKRQATAERGVIYLGHIPHGFYEEQMKGYFSQFGDVTRLRLSRNKKTGRSKHYAFLEFSSVAVAEIVAETMDNYLLCGHILRCKLVPKEEVHPKLWIGANKKYRRVPHERIERLKQNKTRSDKERKKVEKRLLKRQQEKKRKLKELGIDYDVDAVGYGIKKKSKTEDTAEATPPVTKKAKRSKKST